MKAPPGIVPRVASVHNRMSVGIGVRSVRPSTTTGNLPSLNQSLQQYGESSCPTEV